MPIGSRILASVNPTCLIRSSNSEKFVKYSPEGIFSDALIAATAISTLLRRLASIKALRATAAGRFCSRSMIQFVSRVIFTLEPPMAEEMFGSIDCSCFPHGRHDFPFVRDAVFPVELVGELVCVVVSLSRDP